MKKKSKEESIIEFNIENLQISFDKSNLKLNDNSFKFKVITYGKYKGTKWVDIHTQYLYWCINSFPSSDYRYKMACVALYNKKYNQSG